jgi:hypothetical protein
MFGDHLELIAFIYKRYDGQRVGTDDQRFIRQRDASSSWSLITARRCYGALEAKCFCEDLSCYVFVFWYNFHLRISNF